MTNPDGPEISALEQDIYEIYRDFVREIATYESDATAAVPNPFDVGSVRGCLELPLQLWESGEKSTRAVPTLVAYEEYLDKETFEAVARVLVGLDVFVTMLDEFIDADHEDTCRRTNLAVNVAFSSLLAFTSIPADAREPMVEALTVYLVEASRIPIVERGVEHVLSDAAGRDDEMELIRAAYEFRARDVAAFGTLPALVSDVDDEVADRIERDLRTYRAQCLLYDDVEDVDEDRRNGIETVVTWLLDRHDDPEVVAARIEAIRDSFEYSDADYADSLSEMAPERTNLVDKLASAMVQGSQ